MLFPTLDDTAILYSKDGFLRPSDVYERGEVELMCTPRNVRERVFEKFIAKPVQEPYVLLRGTHGYSINVGYTSMFIESRGPDYKKHLENIPAIKIKRKFGYILCKIPGFQELGYSNNFKVKLSDFTRRVSGEYDIATEDFFRFIGWFVKSSVVSKSGCVILRTKYESFEYYNNLLKRLNFEPSKVIEKARNVTFHFDRTWFIDLVAGLVELESPHHIIDEVCLCCGKNLAKAFRDGFVNCCRKDNYFKHKERDRYTYRGDYQTMSDLSFIWNKAGFNVTTNVKFDGTIRLEECSVPFYNYITEVNLCTVPKKMYQIIPVNDFSGSLWVCSFRFRVFKSTKDK